VKRSKNAEREARLLPKAKHGESAGVSSREDGRVCKNTASKQGRAQGHSMIRVRPEGERG
jgi:hypothetical protein